jgi:hypothetical protein
MDHKITCGRGFPHLLTSAVLLLAAGTAGTDMAGDLQSMGIPVSQIELDDTSLVVSMEGSLADGDTLLKRYGGVFFCLLDSISAGWPIVGLYVDIPGSTLGFLRVDMYEAVSQMQGGGNDEAVALWVLQHTRVYHSQ